MTTVRVRLHAGKSYAEGIADDEIGHDAGGFALVGQRLDDSVRWVDLPPELGGGRGNVIGSVVQVCPCGSEPSHDARALVLDRDELCVTECHATRRFLWWAR